MNSAIDQQQPSRHFRRAILAAAFCTVSSNAHAFTYVFSSGTYASGTTSPNPLLSPDILAITTTADKSFNGVGFVNQSGTVSWQGGNIALSNGSTLDNRSLWTISTDSVLGNGGGAASSFLNSGVFRKTAGSGTTLVSIRFVNSGTIDAQSGTVAFQNSNTVFNAGTAFTGSGTSAINAGAAFNGAISSTNLRFNAGYYTGTAAALSGTAQWRDGYFTGDWQLTSGSTLNAVDSGFKTVSAGNVTNNGTINWQGGSLYLQNGSQFANTGLLDFQTSASILNNGGAQSTFTNGAGGTVRVATGQTLTVSNRFVSDGGTLNTNGTTNFQGGNAVFNAGTAFTGSGTTAINSSAAFNGAFSSTNLQFNAGYFTGTAAELNGTAQWRNGYFTGDWRIANGATLDMLQSGLMTLSDGNVTNNGTINWQGGSLYLQNGSQFANTGLLDFQVSTSILNNGGAQSTFTNGTGGTVHVAAGQTLTVNNRFVSDGGTLDTDGTTNFQGANAVFNTGTLFTGNGTNAINSSAAFNGIINSTNLRFNAGYFTGTAAELRGHAEWRNGYFTGDWQIANGATLDMLQSGLMTLSAGSVTNNGTINWQGGSLYLQNGSQFTNTGLLDFQVSTSILNNGGAQSTFTNGVGGTVHVAGGQTLTVSNRFVSDGGTLDSDGLTQFQGANAVFNDGTVFTGSGTNAINSSAAFSGLIGSTNLRLNAGYYTGTAAALSGTTDWQGGYFQGEWQVTGGSTLNVVTTGFHVFNAVDFTNNGTMAWSAGELSLANASTIVNSGRITITGNDSATNGGGAASSFVNQGLIQKTGGGGTTTIGDGIGFDNQGVISVTSGTIVLPTNFTNNGTLAGTGAFQLAGTLTNNGILAPGTIPSGRGNAVGTPVSSLTLSGNYLQSASGTLAAQLQSSTLSDMFLIRGGAQLNGTLALSCVGGCAIQNGDVFTLLQAASGNLSGAFSNVTTTGFLNGFSYNVLYDYNAGLVQLSVTDVGGGPVGNVPEPAAWMMLIGGFGLLGGSLRRRRLGETKILTN